MTIERDEGAKKASEGWKGDWVSGNLGPDAPRSEVHKQNNLRFLLTIVAFVLAWLLAQMVENPKPKSIDAVSNSSISQP